MNHVCFDTSGRASVTHYTNYLMIFDIVIDSVTNLFIYSLFLLNPFIYFLIRYSVYLQLHDDRVIADTA